MLNTHMELKLQCIQEHQSEDNNINELLRKLVMANCKV